METSSGICRICSCSGSLSEKLISIHSRDGKSGLVIAAMVEELGGVIVSSEDFRPQEICYDCVQKVTTGYAIRQAIREVEKASTQVVEMLQQATEDDDGAKEEQFVVGSEIKLEQLLEADEDEFGYEYEYLEEEYLSENTVKDHNHDRSVDICRIEFVDVTNRTNKRLAESPTEDMNQQASKKNNIERTYKKTSFVMPKSEVVLRKVDHQNHLLVEVKGDRCCGCSFVGKNRKELLQHSDSEHAIEILGSGNYCPICFYKFNSENTLTRHIDDCRSKSIYVCKACERYFNSPRKIEMHLEQCQGPESSCVVKVSSSNEVDVEYDGEGDGFESQICDEDQSSAVDGSEDESNCGSDWENMVGELEAEGLLMESRVSPEKANRKKHKAELLEQIEDYIKSCDGVPPSNINENRVVRRVFFETFQFVRISGERCCGCTFTCDKRDQLFIHAKEAHGNHEDISFGCFCPICYTNFENNKELSKHINCTTSKYLLICTLCNEAFSGKRSLKYHQEHSEKHRQYVLQPESAEKVFIELNDADVLKAIDRELPELNSKTGNRARANNRSITRHRHLNMPDSQFIIHVDDQQHYEVLTVNGERCCGCGQFFETYDELLQHGRTIHLVENAESLGEYQCDVCFARFEWNRGLLMHRSSRRTVNKLFHCKICNLIFSKQHSIKNHLLQAPNHLSTVVVEDEATGSEDLEGRKLDSTKENSTAKLKPTEPKYHCCLAKCPEEFPNEDLLLAHCVDRHAGKRRENEAERTSQQNVCPGCFKAFENTTCLVWHRVNRFNKQYICRFCGQVFNRWPTFREHEDTVHLGKSTEYPCDKCEKVFRTPQRLKNHQETHSEQKKHVCDVCGANFRNKGVLKRHRRTVHASEYPFACPCCPKKLPTQEQLNAHTRVHTGVKPYACRFCERSFSHFTDRKRHEMSTHTGERPYQCPHCPAAYIRNRELVIHVQKHTDDGTTAAVTVSA
ncbi:zinc finger protein 62-like [Ochlerotatus camptorhynchus]|uniref:zinc finger protein 62-like n=1 Tax=Ochlerotatus camptorhynchus TaxID=644619 RepID=UPI0031D61EEE